ncbi:MAG TPA: hypothetical protein QGH10_07375 [Armatimonadota bacterium]|nr:hypothetical protein [Armatimonadota bacterium]
MIADKLLRMDRRIVFVLIALAVGLPLVLGLQFPAGENPRTQAIYDHIESLEPRDVVIISFDYGPSSMPELNPMAAAVARHALSRDLRVVGMTLYPDAPILIDKILNRVGRDLGKESGVDYVNLGYRPGYSAVILQMSSDIGKIFETDFEGRPYSGLEVTQGLRNFDDVGLVLDLSSSDMPGLWVLYAYQDYHATIAAGVTAVMAQDYYPHLQAGQLIGMLNGMKGAAEYEKLVDQPGDAMGGMAAQSFSQFLIIGLVLLGNVCYFIARKRGTAR